MMMLLPGTLVPPMRIAAMAVVTVGLATVRSATCSHLDENTKPLGSKPNLRAQTSTRYGGPADKGWEILRTYHDPNSL